MTPPFEGRPFEGIRVIDVTHVLAGPFAAYQLAVLGADVIKVEHPDEPDQSRGSGTDKALNRRNMGTAFLTQASNKRSITLDLKAERDREILRKLVATADVFVENYRPGAFEALGLGYAALATAQQSTGNIAGRVVDEQGAGIAGAAVSARQPATGFVREVVTDGNGLYLLSALPVGAYDVTTMQPPPWFTMQQSSSLSGSATGRDASTSSMVMAPRPPMTDIGLSMAWRRAATATSAIWASVVP